MTCRAINLVPKPIPLAGRGREKSFGPGAPGCEDVLQTPPVVRSGRRGRELLADYLPQAFGRRIDVIEGQRVEPACSVAAGCHPVAVGQRLQMAADGRL